MSKESGLSISSSKGVPPDRAFLLGRQVKIHKIRFGEAEIKEDGSVSITMFMDFEYEPIYQAVIHLGE